MTSHLGTSPRKRTISGLPPATKPYRDFPQQPNHIGTSPRKRTISGLPPATKPYRDFPQQPNHIGTSPSNQTISGLPPATKPYRDFPQRQNYIGTSPSNQTISEYFERIFSIQYNLYVPFFIRYSHTILVLCSYGVLMHFYIA